jgi:hypothetical protein
MSASGDPNFPGARAIWPRFEPDPDYAILHSFRADECKLWADYAQQ